jgi:hypothetical protein
MDSRWYYIKISPEVIKNDLFVVDYNQGNETLFPDEFCCNETTTTTTVPVTGYTYVYSSMTDILSGGTNGNSLLTGLTVPIMLTETTVDIGYYSVFDGFVLQKDTMTNFLFSGDPFNPYVVYFYNTSEIELKKYLAFSTYSIDWGDGTIESVPNTAPTSYSHSYVQDGTYTITMTGASPWGVNVIKKEIQIPVTLLPIPNPNGTAYFIPAGGSWSGTPLMYDYLFTGDSFCDVNLQSSFNFTTVPFLVTGYTNSYVTDLEQWGSKFDPTRFAGKYKIGVQVTGTSESVGTFWGPSIDGLYTAYTINDIDYYDYNDGTTLFMVQSSGFTPDWLVCSAITKNEVLLNVIDEAEIQSNVFIERGKNSAYERIQRLGEVDNVGDLEKYGYKFFNIINII